MSVNNECIDKALEQICADIAALERLRDGLVEIYGDGRKNDGRPAAKPAVRKAARKSAASRTPRAPKPPRSPAKTGEGEDSEDSGPIRVGSVQHRVLTAAMRLPEPFTAESVAKAMGIEKGPAGGQLVILAKKGLIEAVGREGAMKAYRVVNG